VLDSWITRLERYEVAQSAGAAEVRTAIQTMDDDIDREEAEAARKAEAERRRIAEQQRIAREEEQRRRLAEEKEAAERRRREEEEEEEEEERQRREEKQVNHDEDDDEEEDYDVRVEATADQAKKTDPPVITGREKVSVSPLS
jgi:hypothetical protein